MCAYWCLLYDISVPTSAVFFDIEMLLHTHNIWTLAVFRGNVHKNTCIGFHHITKQTFMFILIIILQNSTQLYSASKTWIPKEKKK